MPNARILSDLFRVGLLNDIPRVSLSKSRGSTITREVSVAAGTPIGLLLALTYPAGFSGTVTEVDTGGEAPSARIINN